MKKIIVSMMFIFLLTGCNGVATILPTTELFDFKHSYIGDNTAVVGIVNNLMASRSFRRLELITDNEPYGVILEYRTLEDEERTEMIINNSVFMFALIDNVDWITFQFSDEQYTITRDKLELWMRGEISNFDSQEKLEELIQEKLQSEFDVNQFFRIFCCGEPIVNEE